MEPIQSALAHDRGQFAFWYACGRNDAGGPLGDPEEFRQYAARQAEQYYLGRTSYLPSIQDQWAAFLAR